MAQLLSALHLHTWSSTWRTLFDSTFSTFYFFLFLLSVPVFLFHLELFPELLYTKDMANLRRSATNEGEDTSDVFITSTGYESKAHDFDELYDSSVPFSLMIPSTDQDVDDLTLGEMLREKEKERKREREREKREERKREREKERKREREREKERKREREKERKREREKEKEKERKREERKRERKKERRKKERKKEERKKERKNRNRNRNRTETETETETDTEPNRTTAHSTHTSLSIMLGFCS